MYLAEAQGGPEEGCPEEATRSAIGQMAKLVELWPDPGSPNRFLAVTDPAQQATRHEVGVSLEEGVSESIIRAIRASSPDSVARLRIQMVSLTRVVLGHGRLDV
jgi:hypothetical protein